MTGITGAKIYQLPPKVEVNLQAIRTQADADAAGPQAIGPTEHKVRLTGDRVTCSPPLKRGGINANGRADLLMLGEDWRENRRIVRQNLEFLQELAKVSTKQAVANTVEGSLLGAMIGGAAKGAKTGAASAGSGAVVGAVVGAFAGLGFHVYRRCQNTEMKKSLKDVEEVFDLYQSILDQEVGALFVLQELLQLEERSTGEKGRRSLSHSGENAYREMERILESLNTPIAISLMKTFAAKRNEQKLVHARSRK